MIIVMKQASPNLITADNVTKHLNISSEAQRIFVDSYITYQLERCILYHAKSGVFSDI